jgi:hypothetical protein
MSCADRIRLAAHWLSERRWPRFITEAMQSIADRLER